MSVSRCIHMCAYIPSAIRRMPITIDKAMMMLLLLVLVCCDVGRLCLFILSVLYSSIFVSLWFDANEWTMLILCGWICGVWAVSIGVFCSFYALISRHQTIFYVFYFVRDKMEFAKQDSKHWHMHQYAPYANAQTHTQNGWHAPIHVLTNTAQIFTSRYSVDKI